MERREKTPCTILLFLLLVLFSNVQSQYQLVWTEDFAGPSLNQNKWEYEIDCWGGGNLEKQCYVKNPSTLQVSNGLTITPVYHPDGYKGSLNDCTNNNENSCTWKQPVTSARIRTKDHASWLYGKFVVEAKLPDGLFLWPAVWLLPSNNTYGGWPTSGEIDLIEFRSQEPKSLEQTIHFAGEYPKNTQQSGKLDFSQDFTSGFHTFGLEWTPEAFTWTVDNKVTFTAPLNRSFWNPVNGSTDPYNGQKIAPFNERFYLIVNLAVGGNFFPSTTYGTFNASESYTTWNNPYTIKSIKVWQDPNISPIDTNNSTQPENYVPPPQDSPSPSKVPDDSPMAWFYNTWQNPTIVALGAVVVVQAIALICCACRRRKTYSHVSLSDY